MTQIWQFPVFKWAYDYILVGVKTVESRVSDQTKPEKDYRFVRPGHVAVFSVISENGAIQPDDEISYEILEIHNYPTPRDLLEAEGLKNVFPHKDTIEEGIKVYDTFPKVSERIPKYGIHAFPLGPRLWSYSKEDKLFMARLTEREEMTVDKIVDGLCMVEGLKFTHIDRSRYGDIRFKYDESVSHAYNEAGLDRELVHIEHKKGFHPLL